MPPHSFTTVRHADLGWGARCLACGRFWPVMGALRVHLAFRIQPCEPVTIWEAPKESRA